MSRPPQINIMAGVHFTTATVRKTVVAVRWCAGECYYVALPGQGPHAFAVEGEAVRFFLRAAMDAR